MDQTNEQQNAQIAIAPAAYDLLPIGVLCIDLTGKILWHNSAAANVVGLSGQELIGCNALDYVHPEQLAEMKMALANWSDGSYQQIHDRFAAELARPDGSRVVVEATTTPLRDSKQIPHSLILTITNLNEEHKERIRGETALRIQRDLGLAISTSDDLGEALTLVLDAIMQLPGIDAAGIYLVEVGSGDHVLAVQQGLDPMQAQQWGRHPAQSQAAGLIGLGRSQYGHYPLVAGCTACDAAKSASASAAIVPISLRGEILGSIHLMSCVHAEFPAYIRHTLESLASSLGGVISRIKTQQQVILSEQRYRRLFTQAPVGIMHFDESGVMVECNDFFSSMFGAKREQLIGMKLLEQLRNEPLQTVVRQALEGKEGSYEGEYEAIVSGQKTYISGVCSPLFGIDDQILGGVVFCEDVSEIMRANQERQELETQVQQAQKLESLGLLAGGVAHDFNNLLVGILGNAGLARMDLPPDSPVRQHIDHIELAGRRASELTNQMLAYSGKGAFLIDQTDVSQVINEMILLLKTGLSRKIEVRLNIEEQLPTIECDTTQIRQVVMNLITNASDSIGDAQGVITLALSKVNCTAELASQYLMGGVLSPGDYLCLNVKDTGQGMEQSTIARIFDPFYTTKARGRGLGLAVVMGIIRSHNGAIRVLSEAGVGTEFSVLLPCQIDDSAPAVGKHSAVIETGTAGTSQMTILLVDDEEFVRQVSRLALERQGYRVIEAADGQEGLTQFQRHHAEIDLVLLDMMMPYMTGDELFPELIKLKPKVKVVLSSGFSEQESTEQFGERGLDGFIHKPYLPKQLLEVVEEVLGNSH